MYHWGCKMLHLVTLFQKLGAKFRNFSKSQIHQNFVKNELYIVVLGILSNVYESSKPSLIVISY